MRIGRMLALGEECGPLRVCCQYRFYETLGSARCLLRDRAYFPILRPGDFTLIRRHLPEDHSEQRRFASAVAPDKPDAASSWQSRAGAIQDLTPSNSDDDVVDGEHSRARIPDWLARPKNAA